MTGSDEIHEQFIVADKETLFLLGNGPSLKNIDLSTLENFSTIGMNAAYRYWREINWWPTYYACLDLVVGLSHKEAISDLITTAEEKGIRKILLRDNLIRALGKTAITPKIVNFDYINQHDPLLASPTVTTGSHAALWAASNGYKKIVMLGIDGNYKEIVPGAKKNDGYELEIVSQAENPNYFFEKYQQPGDKYNVPNPRPGLHVEAWRDAALAIAKSRIQIYNGNENSEVRFFDFIDVEKMLLNGSPVTRTNVVPAADDTASDLVSDSENIALKLSKRILRRFKRSPLLFLSMLIAGLLPIAISAIVTGPTSIYSFIIAIFTAFGAVTLGLLLLTRRRQNLLHISLESEIKKLDVSYRELFRQMETIDKERMNNNN